MSLENKIVPVVITSSINITRYYIRSVFVVLYQSVEIDLIFLSDNDKSYQRKICLCDDLYLNWGSSDDYLMDYIQNNVEEIINI